MLLFEIERLHEQLGLNKLSMRTKSIAKSGRACHPSCTQWTLYQRSGSLPRDDQSWVALHKGPNILQFHRLPRGSHVRVNALTYNASLDPAIVAEHTTLYIESMLTIMEEIFLPFPISQSISYRIPQSPLLSYPPMTDYTSCSCFWMPILTTITIA